jgi:hypothetical protein
MNHCGTCTACCRVFAITELEKPAGKWCQHCDVGVGCQVYDTRPSTCVEFKCLWLLSKDAEPQHHLPDALRPDRCKVVFSPSTNEDIYVATTLHGYPLAWRKHAVHSFIRWLVKKGKRVSVGPAAATDLILISATGETPVKMSVPDETGMQWRIDGGP